MTNAPLTTRSRRFQLATSNSYYNEYNPRTGGSMLRCDLPDDPEGLPKLTLGQMQRELAEFRSYQTGNDYGYRVWVDGRRISLGFYDLDELNQQLGYL